MAKDTANGISYFLQVGRTRKDDFGAIRHWANLKIAFEEDAVWVRDFTAAQIEALEVKSLPFKTVYYATDGKLFKWGSRLPHRNVPALLWTPIERALPIHLPARNHNYFGIPDKANIRLVPSDAEREAYGLLTTLDLLNPYIESAPAIRLQHLHWALVDGDKAIILGMPQLPIPGTTFWQQRDFLLPAGYDFEWPFVTGMLQELVSKHPDAWIVWEMTGQYWQLNKDTLQPLSISSFRQSIRT